jgi:uncharacterized protein
MQTSVYDVTTGQFIRSLTALQAILSKASQFADQKRIAPEVLLGSRLAPDQFPLSRQIQMVCDNAKLCSARLTGAEAPKHDDKEQTLPEFLARIDSTLAFLQTLQPEQYEKFADKQIKFPWNPGVYLTGRDYVAQYALPNFYFHLTTAYAILRHNGLDVGKSDYLGAVAWRKE